MEPACELSAGTGLLEPDPEIGATWCVDDGVSPPRYYTLDGYRTLVYEYYMSHPSAKGLNAIYPEAILGFRTGDHVDFQPYFKIGFVHPKREVDYDIRRGEQIRCMDIYNGIANSERLLESPLIYPYRDPHTGDVHLVCLDGVTRLSGIGYARLKRPEAYRRISVDFQAGGVQEALCAMINRNVESIKRSLRPYEFARSLYEIHTKADPLMRLSVEQIAAGVNMSEHDVRMRLALFGKDSSEAVRRAFEDGDIQIYHAYEIITKHPANKHKELIKGLKTGCVDMGTLHKIRPKKPPVVVTAPVYMERAGKQIACVCKALKETHPDREADWSAVMKSFEAAYSQAKIALAKITSGVTAPGPVTSAGCDEPDVDDQLFEDDPAPLRSMKGDRVTAAR